MASKTPRGRATRKPARKPAGGKSARKRHPHIASVAALHWEHVVSGKRFEHERKRLGQAAGGVQLGTSLFRLPPGKVAFPAHFHHANEEAIYVLSGSGSIRIGAGEYPLAAGDYVALPVGADEAHQVRNTSRAPLEYLCISTMIHPEISEYPDSGKYGLFTGGAPGGTATQRRSSGFYMQRARVDYYKGE